MHGTASEESNTFKKMKNPVRVFSPIFFDLWEVLLNKKHVTNRELELYWAKSKLHEVAQPEMNLAEESQILGFPLKPLNLMPTGSERGLGTCGLEDLTSNVQDLGTGCRSLSASTCGVMIRWPPTAFDFLGDGLHEPISLVVRSMMETNSIHFNAAIAVPRSALAEDPLGNEWTAWETDGNCMVSCEPTLDLIIQICVLKITLSESRLICRLNLEFCCGARCVP